MKVTQVRSVNGADRKQRDTLRSLGLRKIGHTVEVNDTPQAKGMVFGLNLTHERGDLFRALLEGIACGTNHIFETYADVGQEPAKIFAVGGGTDKSRAFIADQLAQSASLQS